MFVYAAASVQHGCGLQLHAGGCSIPALQAQVTHTHTHTHTPTHTHTHPHTHTHTPTHTQTKEIFKDILV